MHEKQQKHVGNSGDLIANPAGVQRSVRVVQDLVIDTRDPLTNPPGQGVWVPALDCRVIVVAVDHAGSDQLVKQLLEDDLGHGRRRGKRGIC